MKKPKTDQSAPSDPFDGEPSDIELERIYLQLKGETDEFLDVEVAGAKHAMEMIARVAMHEQTETDKHVETVKTSETLVEGVFSKSVPHDSIPEFIGRFKIKRVIGKGGFGIVFLALDPNLGRDVALKIPRPEAILTSELKARFVREGKSAASLAHPGIVPVYESGQVGSLCYLACEFIDGMTLAEFIRSSESPDCRTAAKIAAAISEAISHAHQRKVLHRDIKPANILIANDPGAEVQDRIRITDFGLAKNEADNNLQTKSGALIGTPAYMSPEQASQQTASASSDIYSIGAVLYELITGKPPVEESNLLVAIQSVLTKDPTPPRRINSKVPRDLEAICLKCLDKNPNNRYANAFELNEDLNRFLNDQPVLARSVSQVEYVRRWFARNPLLATASSLALLATVALIVGLSVGLYWLSKVNKKSEMLVNISNRAVFDSKISEARAQRLNQDSKSQENSLSALKEAIELIDKVEMTANDALDLRSELATSLSSYIPMMERSWLTDTVAGRGCKFGFSPDLQKYAVATPGGIVIRLTDDNSLIREIEIPNDEQAKPTFSPNGKLLMVEYSQSRKPKSSVLCLKVVSLSDGKEVLSITPRETSTNSFSSDSSKLLCPKRGSNSVKRFSLSTGKELDSLELPFEFDSSLAPCPNGSFLAFVHSDKAPNNDFGSRLAVIELESGRTAYSSPRYRHFISDIAWTEQGKSLGFIQTQGVSFLRFEETRRKFVSEASGFMHRSDVVSRLDISPNGALCMVTYSDNTTEFYDRISKRLIFKAQGRGVNFGVNHDVGFASNGKPVEVWNIRQPIGYRCVDQRAFGAVDAVAIAGRNIYTSVRAKKKILLRAMDSIDRNTHRSLSEQSRSVLITDSDEIFTCNPAGFINRWRWVTSKPQEEKISLSGYRRTEVHKSGRLDGTICKSGNGKKLGYQIKNDYVIYDIESGVKEMTGAKFLGPWHSLNHDATLVAVGDESGTEPKIFDGQGALIKTLTTSIDSRPKFSIDGQRLLITDVNGFHWYDTQSWKCLCSEKGEVFNERSAAISDDGNFVAITSLRAVEVYRTNPMQIFMRLEIPTASPATTPTTVAFSPDAETVVVGDTEGLLHLWNLKELRENAMQYVDAWDSNNF